MNARSRAFHYLDASESRFAGRMIYAHYDEATEQHWVLDGPDLDHFGGMLAMAGTDEDAAAEAFVRWCRACPGRPVDLNDVVNEYDLDGASDLESAKAEAAAAGDELAYMVLEHWPDVIREILFVNDEIAAEEEG